ncbi:RIP metalloprotease RseP [Antricoccus suffuscus]|uniref:RIP metalloprotease RseP n=1 Tax=Antricoccus suffuscus TaxID=1629062 RepID=A0A2T1A5D8_9ACTN|nr:site-2 protease family protein [Antricoccus suffuscus]PRZ43558.1 RIP metalloprotease RseP [Antricoccus suffuscus]
MIYVLGVLLFIVGLLFSVWFHELGHFLTARAFGMRASQFMVGFGPTIWSKKVGETEYGLKWIPLGGYVRIVGMIPPPKPDAPKASSRIGKMIEDIRAQSSAELQPGDETRAFYTKPWWQRVIVMVAGILQNLILAFILFAIILCGIGVQQPSLTVSSISECVLPATSSVKDCKTPIDSTGKPCPTIGQGGCELPPASPAADAGFRPGDKIKSINGTPTGNWDDVRNKIRVSAGKDLDFVVERHGKAVTLAVTPMENKVVSDSNSKKYVTVGFLGISPTTPLTTQSIAEVPGQVGHFLSLSAQRLIEIPQRVPQLIDATFGSAKRDPNGPVGLVGVGRISGEIFDLPQSTSEKIAYFLSLLASLNMVLCLFNVVPLYPLDGGHAAGALAEGVRNGVHRIRGKPRAGALDVAKMMPVGYVMAVVIIAFSVLLVVADIVNPVTLMSQ